MKITSGVYRDAIAKDIKPYIRVSVPLKHVLILENTLKNFTRQVDCTFFIEDQEIKIIGKNKKTIENVLSYFIQFDILSKQYNFSEDLKSIEDTSFLNFFSPKIHFEVTLKKDSLGPAQKKDFRFFDLNTFLRKNTPVDFVVTEAAPEKIESTSVNFVVTKALPEKITISSEYYWILKKLKELFFIHHYIDPDNASMIKDFYQLEHCNSCVSTIEQNNNTKKFYFTIHSTSQKEFYIDLISIQTLSTDDSLNSELFVQCDLIGEETEIKKIEDCLTYIKEHQPMKTLAQINTRPKQTEGRRTLVQYENLEATTLDTLITKLIGEETPKLSHEKSFHALEVSGPQSKIETLLKTLQNKGIIKSEIFYHPLSVSEDNLCKVTFKSDVRSIKKPDIRSIHLSLKKQRKFFNQLKSERDQNNLSFEESGNVICEITPRLTFQDETSDQDQISDPKKNQISDPKKRWNQRIQTLSEIVTNFKNHPQLLRKVSSENTLPEPFRNKIGKTLQKTFSFSEKSKTIHSSGNTLFFTNQFNELKMRAEMNQDLKRAMRVFISAVRQTGDPAVSIWKLFLPKENPTLTSLVSIAKNTSVDLETQSLEKLIQIVMKANEGQSTNLLLYIAHQIAPALPIEEISQIIYNAIKTAAPSKNIEKLQPFKKMANL